MLTALQQVNDVDSKAMESALVDGDLAKLTSMQRVMYYKRTCESLGLNPFTKPFAYIKLNGKLVLYALKDCTEQLRKRDGVSIKELKTEVIEGVLVATAYAETKDGKTDVATGAVTISNLKGEALANSMMKAETKAKRRVTLSVCGLGWCDESEIESIQDAKKVDVNFETGEIVQHHNNVIATPRQQLIDEINNAQDLTELKDAYSKAWTCHAGNTELLKDLTTLKDLRKADLQLVIEIKKTTPTLIEDGA